jgi:hypothetical protein
VLSPLLILMARSPAVNALNELADELYNAASFIGKPFTVESNELKVTIPRVIHDSLASGASRDDVWRFMRKVKQYTIDDDGVHSILDEGARVVLVTDLMQSFSALVRICPTTVQDVSEQQLLQT